MFTPSTAIPGSLCLASGTPLYRQDTNIPEIHTYHKYIVGNTVRNRHAYAPPQNIPKQATDGMSNGTQFQPMPSSVLEKKCGEGFRCVYFYFRESFWTRPSMTMYPEQIRYIGIWEKGSWWRWWFWVDRSINWAVSCFWRYGLHEASRLRIFELLLRI